MYYRFIKEALVPTIFASDSGGKVVAALKKLIPEDDKSWQVATGPEKNETIHKSDLGLEEAMQYAEVIEVSSQ